MADSFSFSRPENPAPRLFTAEQWRELLVNAEKNRDGNALDFPPVVKLFTPDASATWLVCEADDDGCLFGICDLGL